MCFTAIPRIRAPRKIMLQTPMITAASMTAVRRGLRQMLRHAIIRYIIIPWSGQACFSFLQFSVCLQNSKSEARNSKQILNSNVPMTKTRSIFLYRTIILFLSFEFWSFEIVSTHFIKSGGFRYSDFFLIFPHSAFRLPHSRRLSSLQPVAAGVPSGPDIRRQKG